MQGYARWNRFKKEGLKRYARRRNDALVDGVSRMSAYLHYGMVSPFRLAREAAELQHSGAEKYLDELLIWRELAYTFCFHRDDHNQLSALPTWARDTLQKHAVDRRATQYSWEELARGRTADPLWNAAQRSLLIHGELHNNVRMTWGKALLQWTPSPQRALELLIDLNHRYALDGRDPASYGGILWCLGQFDRPFQPEKPILGTVRPRATKDHARRLDAELYAKRVELSRRTPDVAIAVIGAGLAGLHAARVLADHGMECRVFEAKARLGGRLASLLLGRGVRYDAGAQYFTAKTPLFRRVVRSWEEQGLVARWATGERDVAVLRAGRIERGSSETERWVGVPTMEHLCNHLAKDLDIRLDTAIRGISTEHGRHVLRDAAGAELGSFTHVLLACPPAAALPLLGEAPQLAAEVCKVEMMPSLAGCYLFKDSIGVHWSGAFLNDGPLTWAARNQTKAGRVLPPELRDSLVLHAGASWSRDHWESDADAQLEGMLRCFWEATGVRPVDPVAQQRVRWTHAQARSPLNHGVLVDTESRKFVCGDWVHGSRVEGAFMSGAAAAGRLLGTVGLDASQQSTQSTLF